MKARILSKDEMRMARFTDHNKNEWYYVRRIYDIISFNITIDKCSGEYEIDILDENILQPFPYEQLAKKGNKIAIMVSKLVALEIERLKILGILEEEKLKKCTAYEDGCEEWAGCPCAYYKVE